MNRRNQRVDSLALELIESKYFAMNAAPDVRIRLATEAAIRQVNREREARHRMINRVADVTLVLGILGPLVFMVLTA